MAGTLAGRLPNGRPNDALLAHFVGADPLAPLPTQVATAPSMPAGPSLLAPLPDPSLANGGSLLASVAGAPSSAPDGPFHYALPGALTPPHSADSMAYAPPHYSRGQMIMGIIADGLAGAAGQPGQFAARLDRNHQEAAAQAQWTRRQASELQSHKDLYSWEQANKAAEVDSYTAHIAALNANKAGQGDTWAANTAATGGNPFGHMFTDPLTGQQYAAPATGSPPPAGIHPDAITRLRAHPQEAPQFDAQFGAGSSAHYLGGAAPAGTRTFPAAQ
jgi:hypothetical protein